MALVSRVIGDCPACGRQDGYGNVNVSNDVLLRGCLSCRHLDHVPLPKLNKKVLYLDQFFYSHAFRANNALFIEAKAKIQAIAHKQLLVAPYCNIHEDETQLWQPEQREPLWKFIKQTSMGHNFKPEYRVKEHQLHRAFQLFLAGEPPEHRVERDDALPSTLNRWDDYVWIDVGRMPKDADATRAAKQSALKSLLDVFPNWASTPSTFDRDVRAELRGAAESYVQLYAEYVKRIVEGDVMALFTSLIDSQVIEKLLHYNSEDMAAPDRFRRIQAFFASDHYANVPLERISSEFFALLRHFLRQGAFVSRDKSEKRFKGFFYDVRFISTYAPYCDAMVVDALMHRWASDPLIDLPRRYGTRFFSRTNWHDFLAYLDEIENTADPLVMQALEWVHPPNATFPDWSQILARRR